MQADFDKYLRLYSRESEKLKRQRKTLAGGKEEQMEALDFQKKWSEFLVLDEKKNDAELQELLGLDSY